LAALILATLPTHVHFSRLALNNAADPFFGTMALALLARGMHSHRAADFAMAGAFLGLTQYFYEGGRLVYPILTLIWLVFAVSLWKRKASGILITLITAVIIAFPVYYALHGLEITPRLDNQRMSFYNW